MARHEFTLQIPGDHWDTLEELSEKVFPKMPNATIGISCGNCYVSVDDDDSPSFCQAVASAMNALRELGYESELSRRYESKEPPHDA